VAGHRRRHLAPAFVERGLSRPVGPSPTPSRKTNKMRRMAPALDWWRLCQSLYAGRGGGVLGSFLRSLRAESRDPSTVAAVGNAGLGRVRRAALLRFHVPRILGRAEEGPQQKHDSEAQREDESVPPMRPRRLMTPTTMSRTREPEKEWLRCSFT